MTASSFCASPKTEASRTTAALRSLCNGNNTYGRLQELFYKADDRYNSGLFHFRHEKDEAEPPDNLTPKLTIDDKPLKEILKRLYYPDSPYEFSVLPADILGQVYEQFLGKVIRLTSDHRAVVEDKPEVKKAGGVFYTPTYIVDYIVKNTVGKLLEGKTPKTGAEPAHPRSRLRLRFISAWRLSVPARLALEVVHRKQSGKTRQSQKAHPLSGTGRRVAFDHRRAQTDSAQQHLWRGY